MTPEEKQIILDMHRETSFSDMRTALVQRFDTGATRSSGEGKPEYAGYLSPVVIQAFGAYMLAHQTQADGSTRDCRNWQRGIPLESYMQSMMRHFVEVWSAYEEHRKHDHPLNTEATIDSLMALLFNVMGMAHEVIDG